MDSLPDQGGRTGPLEDIAVTEDPLSTGRTLDLEISTDFLAGSGGGGAFPQGAEGRS